MNIGAQCTDNECCEFTIWAPLLIKVELKIVSPAERTVPMDKDASGYWRVKVEGVSPGTRYFFRLEGNRERPDPASNFQPEGVHGPSEVIDHSLFKWDDGDWRGIPLSEMVMYELHVGTFTSEGTFDAVIEQIPYLNDLGVNALEIMPVAQFPGDRNWGYDGAYPFAVQNSYGGPMGLKRLVNECHRNGIAVILDVVYNHLGPEGNYIWDFAPYFTDKYKTPWGWAVNYDDAYSDDVRNYFIENTVQWFNYYHIDALRLDAIHGITDMSARPFLHELAERVDSFSAGEGRKFYLIAESDLNDSRIVRPRELGGFGFDAQWNDDFHHALHTLLTGESSGYYEDFGSLEQMAKALREGFVYSGEYSRYRKRRHGNSTKDRPARQFVVFSQNHDQVGNRAMGDRLSQSQPLEKLKLAAGMVMLSPYIPLLFMGEEYGETAPFQYFVSHSDEDLIEAVRSGRREEFSSFEWQGEVPDPQAEGTFLNSRIDLRLRQQGRHNVLFRLYRELIRLRKETPALSNLSKEDLEVTCSEGELALCVRRRASDDEVFISYNFSERDLIVNSTPLEGEWRMILDSSSGEWGGNGPPVQCAAGPLLSGTKVKPHSFVIYRKSKGG